MKYKGLSVLIATALLSFSTLAIDTDNMSEQQLSQYAQTASNSISSRAEAVIALGRYGGQNALIAIARATKASEPELRLAAIEAVRPWRGEAKWDVVSLLLNDSDSKVRGYAGRVLVEMWRGLNPKQKKVVSDAVDIYLQQAKKELSEFDYAMEQADVHRFKRQYMQALSAYQKAVNLNPQDEQAYLYLSDVYKEMESEEQSLSVLKEGEKVCPDSARIQYALGLAYYRQENKTKAIVHLLSATKLDPDSMQYKSVYALASFEQEPEQGIKQMSELYQQSQDPRHLHTLCTMYKRNNQTDELEACISELEKIAPPEAIESLRQ